VHRRLEGQSQEGRANLAGRRLQLPQRHKRRKRLYHKDSSIIRLRPTHPNHVWSIDLVHDKLSNGRRYKMLTVLDEFTRPALAVEVGTRMTADDVLEILYRLFLQHGKPEYVRSDNVLCSEWTADSGTGSLSRRAIPTRLSLSRVQRAVNERSLP